MAIDARIPLGVTPLDPNGFTNALAAGMKMRELRNTADRQAAKDEATDRKNNALSAYGASKRTAEDRAAVWEVDPASGMALDKAAAEGEKNTTEAAYNKIRTDKLTSEATTKKIGVIRELVNSVVDEASYQAVNAQVHQIEPNAERWPDRFDPAFMEITKRRFTTVEQALAQQKADQAQANAAKPHWDSYRGAYVNPPGSQSTTAPPVKPGTVVPGGELPPPEDINAAVLHREGQGPAPTGNVDYSGLSDDGLDELQRTSTFQKGQEPGAPSPGASMPSTPPSAVPTTPPASVGGGYQTPADRDHARDQRQEAKDREAQRVAEERLKLEGRRTAAAEARARPGGMPKLTEAQGKATAFAMRGTEANDQLSALELGSENEAPYRPDTGTQAGKWAGGMTGSPNRFLTPTGQKYEQAKLNFLTAVLRLESGAAIPEGEIATGNQQYFAMPGDSDEVLAQKKQNRDTAMKAMDVVAGPGRTGSASPVQVTPQSDHPAPKPVKVAPLEDLDSVPMPGKYAGKFLTTPEGIRYRSDGSKWIRQ